MPLTKTQICNMALSKIGDTRAQLIDVDTDDNSISRQCLLHYEQTLHELVRMHTWNCTKERAKLVDTGNTPLFGWTYEFSLPSDCLRPLYLTPTDDSNRFLKPQIEWNVEERTIVSNHEEVWLLYIKEPAPADMDALFANAFYTLLATKLAKPIVGDSQLGMTIYNEFLSVVMPEARRVNSFEGYDAPVVDSTWLEATITSPSNLGSSWPPFSQSDYGSFPWS
jgi:hypothetical protein